MQGGTPGVSEREEGISVDVLSLGRDARVCGRGWNWRCVCLSNSSKLCFESLGSSLMGGEQGTKSAHGHCHSPGG